MLPKSCSLLVVLSLALAGCAHPGPASPQAAGRPAPQPRAHLAARVALQPDESADLARLQQQMKPQFKFRIGLTGLLKIPVRTLAGFRTPPDLLQRIRLHAGMRMIDAAPPAPPPPSSFDWNDQNDVSPVRWQNFCGDCWAFATTAAAESAYMIKHGPADSDFSEQVLLDCSGSGTCTSGYSAFDYILNPGTIAEQDLPYGAAKNTCTTNAAWMRYKAAQWGYVSDTVLVPTTDDLKKALQAHGPLYAALYTTDLFKAYKGGVYNELPNYAGDANHAVLITGWDDAIQCWHIKNSWDTAWGEQGFGWVQYDCNAIGYAAAWVEMQ